MNWQEFIFNPQNDWIGRMEKRSRKRFGDENIADEALNYALKRMGENNWERLSKYQGRSKPGTFLYTILNNQLEDFSRKKFGYPRPPLWIERLGSFWKILWKRLCLEREDPKVLSIIYKDNGERTDEIIKAIKAKVTGCGQSSSITSIGGTVSNDNYKLEDEIARYSSDDLCSENMEKQANHNECYKLLCALCHSLNLEVDEHKTKRVSKNIEKQSKQFKELFQLKPEQLILLKLKYQQGYKISAISEILNLKEYTVRRNIQLAEKKIFNQLRDSGLNLDDFLVK